MINVDELHIPSNLFKKFVLYYLVVELNAILTYRTPFQFIETSMNMSELELDFIVNNGRNKTNLVVKCELITGSGEMKKNEE